jgi:hypothetical protein
MTLHTEPGWLGTFTREQYPGAIPNGSRVVKIAMDEKDANPLGTLATVLGSMGHPSMEEPGYFVEWDTMPRVAVFVAPWKIKLVYGGSAARPSRR